MRRLNLRSLLLLSTLSACLFPGASPCEARVELTPCKNNIPPDQQIALGQKAAQQVYKQMPVLPDSSPVTQYIQRLGAKLTAQAPGYKWPYNFHVVDVAEINAFALPGGTIFVNLGTIQAAANEAQLAGVMAHEISHVVLEHSVCNAVKEQRVGLLAGLGQIAAGVMLGGAAGQLAAQGIGMTAGLGFLKMSRGAEQQADLEGVGILYDAGYDPHGMAQFFETIKAKYGEGGAQFMSDHPNPGNRTEYVNKEIASFPPKAHYVTNTPEFEAIQKLVGPMHAYTAKEVSSGAWRSSNANETVGQGVNQPVAQAGAAGTADLSVSNSWGTFKGDGFSMQVPDNWRAYGSRSAAMIAPQGGIARSSDGGAGSVIYGLLTDRYQPQGRMTTGAALDALVDSIVRDNPGLTPGAHSDITASGVSGHSVEAENASANNGRGEQDWIVAFPQKDRSLRYLVFIAPEPDFEKLRPTFSRILQSLQLR